jgi:hypothetical protein
MLSDCWCFLQQRPGAAACLFCQFDRKPDPKTKGDQSSDTSGNDYDSLELPPPGTEKPGGAPMIFVRVLFVARDEELEIQDYDGPLKQV